MTTEPNLWFHLQSGSGEPAWNMALDEALLEFAAISKQPVLRFYSWTTPAATFGYFQRYQEVAALTPLRPLIRRPTGGGLVPHEADWTYSVAIPASHHWYQLPAKDSYKRMHDWVAAGLRQIGTEAMLAPCCSPAGPGQCFVGYEQFDVLAQGRKIAGAAQRRRRDGLLIQGSVQPSRGLNRESWEDAMLQAGSSRFGITWTPLSVTVACAHRAAELAQSHYSNAEYNERR